MLTNVRINPKRINALFVEVLLVLTSSLVVEGFSVQMLNNKKVRTFIRITIFSRNYNQASTKEE
ncbi:hypothetical protein P5G62_009590 [Neobacillus sp. 179-C4.2 HS]|uniref:Uncharacterized protein n=1 Tax=Neobacillus driksii TaxID=3035913 RepID=A0ABV4YST6_9BACI